jgi:hypothetical protein
MSTNGPIDLKQGRRQWFKTTASALGASLVAVPAIAQETGRPASVPAEEGGKSTSHPLAEVAPLHFFSSAEHAMVEELSEMIIPADNHSGGAKAARVADYIDQTLRVSTDSDRKTLWHEGLRVVEVMSQHDYRKSFMSASFEEKTALLTVLSDHDHMTELPEVRFFKELKQLTVTGYYTSKIGIHDELEYKGNRVLQEYVGCDDQGPATK